MYKRENPYLIKDGKFTPEKEDCFRFCFHESECCKKNSGTCPVEGLSLMDVYFVDNLQKGKMPEEHEMAYCVNLAKMLITGKFERPVDIFYCRDGHIGCSDGRHRLCVAQKLNQSGKDVKIGVKVNLLMG